MEKQPHIQLSSDLGIKYAILPGDPARVDRIALHLENTTDLVFSREYKSIKGFYKGVEVLAMSTGMGGASMAIAVEELKNIGIEYIIRVGSCGALQTGIEKGELIIANAAVKDDGASKTYCPSEFPSVANYDLLTCCIQSANSLGYKNTVGIVRSHDSFYIDNEEEVCEYWSKKGVLGADMETSALFTVSSIRGIKSASILNNVVVFKEDVLEGIGSYSESENLCAQGEKAEIITALEAFVLANSSTM